MERPCTAPFRVIRRFASAIILVGALIGPKPCGAQEYTILDAAELATPIATGQSGVLALSVAADAYEALSSTRTVFITGFGLSSSLKVDLELDRFWTWGPGTKFVVGTDHGDVAIPAPRVAFFQGVVSGRPGSTVFLSASPTGLNAVIRVDGAQYFLAPRGPNGVELDQGVHWLFDGLAPEAATQPVRFECEAVEVGGAPPPIATGMPVVTGTEVSRVALVAVDADFEFRQRFSTPADAALYVCELLAAVSVFYETDIQMKLAPSYIRIWDTALDPYNALDTETQLDQFKNYWESNMSGVLRNTAHLVSARDLGGGRAFRDQMCGGSNAYGVNGNMSGSFPRPPQSGSDLNWDIVVLAHELGHSFASPHTHCYSPPIDRCYTEESGCASGAAACQQGTIMSYCHTCTGGLANIDLTFGPIVSSYIESQLILCIGPSRDPCFVDGAFAGTEQGTITNPHRTVARGSWYVAPEGTVSIAAGTYPERMTICQPMRLTATGGVVRIGQ